MILTFMFVAGFILAEGKPEQESAAGAKVGPQYGGTITYFNSRFTGDPPSPDPTLSQFNSLPFLLHIQEPLFLGDMEKYGPRGSGVSKFQYRGYLNPDLIRGNLVDNWEVTYEKITLHVRPGIYWQGTNMVKKVMENRELVAEDIAFDILEFWKECPWGARFNGILKDVYAKDKYTVIVELETYSRLALYYFGLEDRSMYAPPEMKAAGAGKWENQVGTGPWVFEEYEVGSHMSFRPNDIYWAKATIDGKQYKMPFADRIVCPIIPDEATQVAALRTGRIDLHQRPPAPQWDIIDKTAPGIKYASYSVSVYMVEPQMTWAPLDNVAVRRALMVGTDLRAFAILQYSEDTPIDVWPNYYLDPTVYVPLKDRPQDIQILYKYDTALAKKMLADAGYPNGLEIPLTIQPGAQYQDMSSLLQDQWAKIGVKVNISTVDATTLSKMQYSANYPGIAFSGTEMCDPLNTLLSQCHTKSIGTWSNRNSYSNPKVDELLDKAAASLDPVEVANLCKQAGEIIDREVECIPLYGEVWRHYWWPWLQNYYGELTIGDEGPGQLMAYTWVDQDLKKSMGF
ncbi:MAG: ABC transporter substrate-binding protein [Spirochaetales bacterium]|nr:ABC transporter substrate-binding protein [Spirochaetales bacterium]